MILVLSTKLVLQGLASCNLNPSWILFKGLQFMTHHITLTVLFILFLHLWGIAYGDMLQYASNNP